jgi:hypothetical protein
VHGFGGHAIFSSGATELLIALLLLLKLLEHLMVVVLLLVLLHVPWIDFSRSL